MAEVAERQGIDFNNCNWIALISGVLVLVMPFLGAWWTFSVGTEFFSIGLSPFTTEIVALGTPVISPILFWLNMGLLLLMVLFGLVLITGSVLRRDPGRREASDWYVAATSRKPLYLLIMFILVIVILCILMGDYFSMGTGGVSLPILAGTEVISISQADILITAPVRMNLTPAFLFALIASIISFMAGFTGKTQADRKNA